MNRRRQALKLCLDTAVIVVVKIVNQLGFELFKGLKFLQIQQLTFQQPKEILNHRIVQTVTLAAHTLLNAFLLQQPLVPLVLILPALVGMENEIGAVRYLYKGFFHHFSYHGQHRMVVNRVADNITAVKIKDGREVQLLPKQVELCDVGHPLLVGLVRLKVALQKIWRSLTHFAFVGTILFNPDHTDEPELLHEPLHRLVVDGIATNVQLCRDTAVAIPAFIFMIDCCDLLLYFAVFVRLCLLLGVIVIG